MKPFSRAMMLAGICIVCAAGIVVHAEYRNVALNPKDVHHGKWAPDSGYPHASSNSEYGYPPNAAEPRYYAKNAINGDTINTQHATMPYASWGPQRIAGLWWRVDFGKPLEIDKVVLWIRADWKFDQPAPHDSYWKSATLVFSDSTKVVITIDSTANRQIKMIAKKTTTSVTFTNLVASNPDKWCAFTEVQIWGDEPLVKTKPSHSMINNPGMHHSICVQTLGCPTITPETRRAEYYRVDGRKVGEWQRTHEIGAVSLPQQSNNSVVVMRSFR
jgi:hypothetical protein